MDLILKKLLNRHNDPHLMAINNRGHQRRDDAHWFKEDRISRRETRYRCGAHQQDDVISLIVEDFNYAL
ncbi:hypothetical protein D3C76_976700 [compost metagenome]